MKNRCKFLFILIFITASLFYRAGSIVAMAAEENIVPEPDIETKAEAGAIEDPIVEAEPAEDPVVEAEPAAEPVEEPIVEAEPAAKPVEEPIVETEPAAEPVEEPIIEAEPAAESITEPAIETETEETISDGQDLIEWLESHRNTGGKVKLSDNVVLDGYYSFCPKGINMPSVYVDTDKYTITVTGEIDFLSDSHLIFSGNPDGKGVFYIAEKGMLSVEGIVVESGQCALWQEEGAGLAVSNCHISGSTHYADTPFVMYYNDCICAVVEKGQTVNEALPAQISCTVNRCGGQSHNEWLPVSWNLEGTEKQQEERRRFVLQGSFSHAASAEPVQCTVVYNDAPLTFTAVKASVSGCLYTFRGEFTVPEESLPFTVMAEYSFDGENWYLYEEQNVKNTDAGFYIACKSEPVSRAALSNIYIRLQWNDNGTRYFSNVLCYAADDVESVEDIGGSRGGGTSIVNPPDTPQENSGDISSKGEEPNQDTDRNTEPHPVESEMSSDTEETENDIASGTADGGQVPNAEPVNAESLHVDAGQPLHAESADTDAEQPLYAESADTDAEQPLFAKAQDVKEETVTVLSAYGENSVDPPKMSEQTLSPDTRRNNHIVIAAGFAGLSVAAGTAGFFVHFRSGTKR